MGCVARNGSIDAALKHDDARSRPTAAGIEIRQGGGIQPE
jgi:hypothetical protein